MENVRVAYKSKGPLIIQGAELRNSIINSENRKVKF